MTRRHLAMALVGIGCLVAFVGIAVVSLIAAIIITLGVALVVVGLLAVEVPAP